LLPNKNLTDNAMFGKGKSWYNVFNVTKKL
jgi:hypothetical protein